MGKSLVNLLFHGILMVLFLMSGYAGLQLCKDWAEKDKRSIGLVYRFLTNWNFALQFFCFLIYFICDILIFFEAALNAEKRLHTAVNYVFYSINAPASIFITCFFWTMWCVGPQFIFPLELYKIISIWLNNSLHTMIFINVFIQCYLNKWTLKSLRLPFLAYLAFGFSYMICFYWTYFERSLWIYPFFELMEEPYRSFIMIAVVVLFSIFWLSFQKINSWYCNRSKTDSEFMS